MQLGLVKFRHKGVRAWPAGRQRRWRPAPARRRVRGGSPSLDIFGSDTLPDGFRFRPDFLSREEESFLLQNLKGLPFIRASGGTRCGACSRQVQQVLITNTGKTPPSAATRIAGVSLLSPGTFRFRKKAGAKWERRSLLTEPRSVYLLRGPSRTELGAFNSRR